MYIVLETYKGAEHTTVCLNQDGSNVCFHLYDNAIDYAMTLCQEGIVLKID
jgi:hypothetical protein